MTSEFEIREIDWAHDGPRLTRFDASFVTDKIYHVELRDDAMRLTVEALTAPLSKRYQLDGIKKAIDDADLSLAAVRKGSIAGFATVKHEVWNRRAWLTHLYVNPQNQGRGIGTTLIGEAIRFSKRRKARCLWLETQNVNYPAIQFYRKLGFEFCGFDNELYDPLAAPGEKALYFSIRL
ncbi:MAG TPA: GNAT family N-acetyltransferase [Pyrinomonadaceae bacterium]|nr:GNAT family N-acetyltransferase [Pyrinomonadaceae bacterium]